MTPTPKTQRAYCDQPHPGDDAEADRSCEIHHRPKTPRRSPTIIAVPPSAGDPARFGAVLRTENGWAVVAPTSTDTEADARRLGAVTMTYEPLPAVACSQHPAFEADNCPGCGTAQRIGR